MKNKALKNWKEKESKKLKLRMAKTKTYPISCNDLILSDYFDFEEYDKNPESKNTHKKYEGVQDLIGAKIIDIGLNQAEDIEGGLTIDYLKIVNDVEVKKRIVFGYTELGEWIEWQGILNLRKEK